MINKFIFCALSFVAVILITVSCKHEPEKLADGIDAELLETAKNTSGFVWFKNSNVLLPKSSGSGHPQALLRTRYNAVAQMQLDSSGKIKTNATFTEGAIIVKELYSDANTLARYAILYKKSNNPNADANGWVWGYVNANGTVAESSANKGAACIGCHSQANHIDYMLMNKYYP